METWDTVQDESNYVILRYWFIRYKYNLTKFSFVKKVWLPKALGEVRSSYIEHFFSFYMRNVAYAFNWETMQFLSYYLSCFVCQLSRAGIFTYIWVMVIRCWWVHLFYNLFGE
jgi:hypothetical protein